MNGQPAELPLENSGEVWFIADLHLSLDRPKGLRQFSELVDQCALTAHSLYILGDLFDAWIGDDDPSTLARSVKRLLRQLTERGIRVYFQPGNRDFLIGSAFLASTGARALDDFHVIDLFGCRTLLMHGDLLCTDDLAYQKIRGQIRSGHWRAQALAKPLWLRMAWARWYRLKSRWHQSRLEPESLDVNPSAVRQAMLNLGVERLIHGHTHKPGAYPIALEKNRMGQRIVLAPWDSQGQALCWHASGYDARYF